VINIRWAPNLPASCQSVLLYTRVSLSTVSSCKDRTGHLPLVHYSILSEVENGEAGAGFIEARAFVSL
jgi:hypothetical protein